MSSHSYHRIYFHFVWSVKDREAILVNSYQTFVEQLIDQACYERGIKPIAMYVMPDHVHLLVRLPPTIAPATFIGQVKGACAYAFNNRFGSQLTLKWQDGYGVVSVREGEQEKVIRYVENQSEIHANRRTSRTLETTEEL
jgi:putative transposase